MYDLLLAVTAGTLRTIAAHSQHLGAEVGVTLVLHPWGSAPTHHPHVHGIQPGGVSPSTVSAGCAAGRVSSCR